MTDQSGAKPLKIMIAADTYPPHINGAAQFGYRLAQGMLKRGHEVHVVTFRASTGPSSSAREDDAMVHRLRSHSVPTHEYWRICLPWEIKDDISRYFDEVQPDVVHVQCHYMVGKAVLEEAERRGIRMVATNHFMPQNLDPFLPFPKWFKRIVAKNSWRDMGRVFKRAAAVTTPTPLAAKAMHEHAFLRKVLPVSNGIDAADYELKPGEEIEDLDHPVVLFVGRLAQEKHVDVLIEAVAKTPADLNLHVEVVGGGEVRAALEARTAELGMSNRVRFLGSISNEELRRAYLRCTIFCQPGTAELQSLVTLEAMSASKPVVLANAMALPHLVDEGGNGHLFTPGDSDELARKLTSIMALPDSEREAMGKASREMVNIHSIDETLSTFESLYRGDPVKKEAV
ncbi:glycosyltransferase [Arthrobacter sp. H14]|uniref:glycosyltransferase n=1 Tax=Arthrobacter sp. H14 TaxID=1312959 RepID=UPI00047C83F8|nr:glycosyltransferase [Arthrobacter sp. H14]